MRKYLWIALVAVFGAAGAVEAGGTKPSCRPDPCEGWVTNIRLKCKTWKPACVKVCQADGTEVWNGCVKPGQEIECTGRDPSGCFGHVLCVWIDGCANPPIPCDRAPKCGEAWGKCTVVSHGCRKGGKKDCRGDDDSSKGDDDSSKGDDHGSGKNCDRGDDDSSKGDDHKSGKDCKRGDDKSSKGDDHKSGKDCKRGDDKSSKGDDHKSGGKNKGCKR